MSKVKFNRKINICEAFAGYGSQSLALKKLGYEIGENSAIVEWFTDAIEAYSVLHKSYKQLNSEFASERMLSLSANSKDLKYDINNSKDIEQMIKDSKKFVPLIKKYNNYVDINKFQFEHFFDLFTYSFPCQDLSLQGKQRGIQEGTRSGLLLVVEEKIETCFNTNPDILPTWLLMENVTALVSDKHINDLKRWIDRLNEFGYLSKFFKLRASDSGSAQKRDRVFMVSCRDEAKFSKFVENYDEVNIKTKDEMRLTPNNKPKKVLKDIILPLNKIVLTDQDIYLNFFKLNESKNGRLMLDTWDKRFDFEKKNKKNIQISTSEVEKVWNSENDILILVDEYSFNNKNHTLDEINTYIKSRNILIEQIIFNNKKYNLNKSSNSYNFIKNFVDFVISESNDSKLLEKLKIDENYKERFSNFTTAMVVNKMSENGMTLMSRDSDPFIIHTSKIKQNINTRQNINLNNTSFSETEKLKITKIIKENGYIVRYLRTVEKGRLMGLADDDIKKLIKKLKLENEKNNISKKSEKLFGNSISIESLEVIFELMEI